MLAMSRIVGFQPLSITAINKNTSVERENSSGCILLAMQTLFQSRLDCEKLCKYCLGGKNHYQNLLTLFAQMALGRDIEITLNQFTVGSHSSLPKTLFAFFYQEFPILVNFASFVSLVMDEDVLQAIPACRKLFGPLLTTKMNGPEDFKRRFSLYFLNYTFYDTIFESLF